MRLTEFRDRFPITRDRAFLFAGAISPACDPVTAEVERCLELQRSDPLSLYDDTADMLDRLRIALARLANAEPGRIAITENASRASALAIRLLSDRRPDGNVVVDATTYPSSIYTWLSHGRHQIRVAREDGDRCAALLDQVDDATVAVVISHVCPLTGFRHDVSALGDALRDTSTALFVDVSQSLGVIPVDLAAMGVDVAVGTTMKWLLGTPGVGFCFVSPRADDGRLLDIGYASVVDQGGSWPRAGVPPALATLRRLEVGMPALIPVAAATAGAGLLADLGIDTIEPHVAQLVDHVLEVCDELGLPVSTPRDRGQRAGVVAARHPDAPRLAGSARQRGVDIGGYPWGLVRIDPHAFNNHPDVDRLAEVLRSGVAAMTDQRTR